jgi:integrase
MTQQLSLFEQPLPKEDSKVIPFPGTKRKETKHNYRKGEDQTVFPIKKMEQLEAMADWLYENADRKYLLGFVLGINLGLRANELLKLRVRDVLNPDGSVRYIADVEDTTDRIAIHQSKTGKTRTVYLNETCCKAITWYFAQDGGCVKNDFIFSSREGGHIKPDTFRKILKAAATDCNIKQNIGTHTLRKTWGWWQYKTNTGKSYGDVAQLQRLFGHDSPMTTLRYIGIMDEEDKALYHAVELDVAHKIK